MIPFTDPLLLRHLSTDLSDLGHPPCRLPERYHINRPTFNFIKERRGPDAIIPPEDIHYQWAYEMTTSLDLE